MILMNPGPVSLSEGVRQALTGPDLCHREPEFGELQETIRYGLLNVYGLPPQDWAAVLLTGSGTAAMEAMMTSLVPEGGKVLVIENGVYGERLAAIARIHKIDLMTLTYGWGEPFDIRDVEKALNTENGFTHVALVHHETTTGLLNKLPEIGVLCRLSGVGLLVDTVSSFGAEELEFEEWGIAACAGAANKCLHGVPGAAFVIVRRDLLRDGVVPQRTLYLDLSTYCREQDKRTTPFTQSVQVFYAFAQALRELAEQGGWHGRYKQYRRLAYKVRLGLSRLGIQPLLAEEESSVVLSAFYLPDNVSYTELHDALKERGFIIYAGQGSLAHDIIRVSTMGTITVEDIERLLLSVEDILKGYIMETDSTAARPG